MSQNHMTRWIEDADARQFSQGATLDRRLGITQVHYLHLGQTIARMPSWVRQNVSRVSLAAIGCQAISLIRPTPERNSR